MFSPPHRHEAQYLVWRFVEFAALGFEIDSLDDGCFQFGIATAAAWLVFLPLPSARIDPMKAIGA